MLTRLTLAATNPVEYSINGGSTYLPLPANGIIPAVGIDATVKVRVTGTPAAGTLANEPIGVRLGDTGPNDNSAATQNQIDDNPLQSSTEIYTRNITTDGLTPANEKEASATVSIPFGASIKPLAFATALKVASTINRNNPALINDDQITYDLGVRVANQDPSTPDLFQPAALEGTTIQLDGTPTSAILVSDAIPNGTKLQSVSTALPLNWRAVYTTAATASAPGSNPLALPWSTTAPTNLSTVTRVGFIYTAGSLAPGFEQTNLQFTVITDGTDTQIENMAQVFGETVGDATNEVVYDESGDQNPNNYTDLGAPPDATGTHYTPGTDTVSSTPLIWQY
ncbi:MAG: hypothetical protein HC790_12750 [Acaryochloridaceae cyanobacterium CSU_3_4]|nr:hypothetical protein [Acaryochloridaceae cyanobacterium CSU_3_4]